MLSQQAVIDYEDIIMEEARIIITVIAFIFLLSLILKGNTMVRDFKALLQGENPNHCKWFGSVIIFWALMFVTVCIILWLVCLWLWSVLT